MIKSHGSSSEIDPLCLRKLIVCNCCILSTSAFVLPVRSILILLSAEQFYKCNDTVKEMFYKDVN